MKYGNCKIIQAKKTWKMITQRALKINKKMMYNSEKKCYFYLNIDISPCFAGKA